MTRIGDASRLTADLSRRASGGFALPARLRQAAERVFGECMKDVRIHLSGEPRQLNARAFAFGEDIFFAPGEYRPETPEGRFLLGHELAHVVQQRHGRVVGAETDVLRDDALESEADAIGTRFAAFDGAALDGPGAGGIALAGAGRAGMPRRVVQCLMSTDTFKTLTQARGKRNKIKAIESALDLYHAAMKQKPTNATLILQRIRDVFAACNTYMSERPKSGRAGGVTRLQRQVAFEETVFAMLAKAESSGDAGTKWQAISAAKENMIDIGKRPEMSDAQLFLSTQLVTDAITEYKCLDDGGAASEMMQSDMQVLRNIGSYGSTPQELRAVIGECMAVKGMVRLDYGSMRTASLGKNGDGSYTLNHNADQGMGAKERAGSLLHELTHLVIAETFKNTAMLIDINPDASDAEIRAESAYRTKFCNDLMEEIDNNAALFQFMRSDKVPATQGGWLHGALKHKAKYPLTASKYLTGFLNKKAISQGEHDKWDAFGKEGIALQMIEFTPCINQMLLWCHLVGWDTNDVVYQKLLGACQREIGRRRAG